MSDVRWEGLTHEEIYAQVQQGPGGGASADAESAWTTVGTTIRTVDEQLARAVKQIGVDWQGPAADRVHGGMTAMSNWARDAADNATLTTDGIAAQAAGAQHVRAAMPPPRRDLDTAIALAGAGSYAPRATNVGALEDRMAEERALAVDLMNRYTTDSSAHQHLMNYWSQPPSVVVEAAPTGAAQSGAAIGRAAQAVGGLAAAAVGARRTGGVGAAPNGASGPGVGGVSPRAGTGEPGAGAGPTIGRAGAPVPGPPDPAADASTAAGTAGGAPPDRRAAAVLPGTGDAGADLPGAGASTSGTGRLPGSGPSSGGVRRIVPGVPARPGPGGGPGTREAPWNPARPADGVIRGSPPEASPGVGPRGSAGTGARTVVGGPTEDAVAGRLTGPAAAERLAATSRSAPGAGHGILPLGGAMGRPTDQEHRRPGYLVDDTDAFADDRWFTPPVIGGDDLDVHRV